MIRDPDRGSVRYKFIDQGFDGALLHMRPFQDSGSDAFSFLDQAAEQMLGTDKVMLQPFCRCGSKLQRLGGIRCILVHKTVILL